MLPPFLPSTRVMLLCVHGCCVCPWVCCLPVLQQKEKAKAEVKKNTTDVLDQKTAGLKEGKSQLQGTQQKVNQAGQQLKQTQQDVKAVAKDPLKAAATAVINQG